MNSSNSGIYPYEGAPYIAELDDDAEDGTWIVWDGTYHHGFGLEEWEAKEKVDELNDEYIIEKYPDWN